MDRYLCGISSDDSGEVTYFFLVGLLAPASCLCLYHQSLRTTPEETVCSPSLYVRLIQDVR